MHRTVRDQAEPAAATSAMQIACSAASTPGGATVELDGKKAIITGGGRGIGRGIVERFLAEGASLVVLQRSPLEAPLAEQPDVTGIEADLSDPAVLREVVDQAAQQLGGVDVLVNNAGVMFECELEELEPAQWQLMAALNLQAPLFLAQAVVPHMRRRGTAAPAGSGPPSAAIGQAPA